MMQKIKQAFSWLVETVKAGVAWVRDNRPWLQEQAREIARQAHRVLIRAERKVWAKFNQGRILAILTVLYRQEENTTFRQALLQAKAEVRAMSGAEVAQMVVNFFSEPIEAQMMNAAA
jgi:hypothetical protein